MADEMNRVISDSGNGAKIPSPPGMPEAVKIDERVISWGPPSNVDMMSLIDYRIEYD